MSKTWRDKPAKERQVVVSKHERGEHRKMDPYVRARSKNWETRDF